MKAPIYGVIFLNTMLLTACHEHKAATLSSAKKPHTELALRQPELDASSIVRAAVDTIYTTVCATYNGAQDEDLQDKPSLDRRFCTQKWNDVMERCDRIQMKHPGELGAFDYDYWIQAQDWYILSYHVDSISALSDTNYRVLLTLKNGPETTPIELNMLKENNRWLIADMHATKEKTTVMQQAQEYIDSDGANN